MLVAKLCKVKVNEFAIGFGPVIWKYQGKETRYALRAIPLGGFCNMEGEEERSEVSGSFSKASIPRRIAIVAAGATVNIIFGIIVYFILMSCIGMYVGTEDTFVNHIKFAGRETGQLFVSLFDSLKQLFTGKIGVDQMMGPVGISEVVAKTTGVQEFIYLLSVVSLSLGVTNLLPIPALDGGKILLLIIEAIRRKPLSEKFEINIQLLGSSLLIALSMYITYHDITRLI